MQKRGKVLTIISLIKKGVPRVILLSKINVDYIFRDICRTAIIKGRENQGTKGEWFDKKVEELEENNAEINSGPKALGE